MMIPEEEYITILPKFSYDIKNINTAITEINNYVYHRLLSIYNHHNQELSLMLSGGLDSIHTLAVAAYHNIPVTAYTYHYHNSHTSLKEVENASKITDHFNINHKIITISDDNVDVNSIVEKLNSNEPWDILAGLLLSVIQKEVNKNNPGSPIVSAAGADVLFQGGKNFIPKLTIQQSLQEWEKQVSNDIIKTFTYQRFIPDFYYRILQDDNKHYKIWQTKKAVELTSNIHPTLIRGKDFNQDKKILKDACKALNVPDDFLMIVKDPMQHSSGSFELLTNLARKQLKDKYGNNTYSDPLQEDLSILIARYYLQSLKNN